MTLLSAQNLFIPLCHLLPKRQAQRIDVGDAYILRHRRGGPYHIHSNKDAGRADQPQRCFTMATCARRRRSTFLRATDGMIYISKASNNNKHDMYM